MSAPQEVLDEIQTMSLSMLRYCLAEVVKAFYDPDAKNAGEYGMNPEWLYNQLGCVLLDFGLNDPPAKEDRTCD